MSFRHDSSRHGYSMMQPRPSTSNRQFFAILLGIVIWQVCLSLALDLMKNNEIGVAVLDLWMPHVPGDQLLVQIVEEYPQVPVIMITGSNQGSTAVECMRKGACDYIVKPVEDQRLLASVEQALEVRALALRRTPSGEASSTVIWNALRPSPTSSRSARQCAASSDTSSRLPRQEDPPW